MLRREGLSGMECFYLLSTCLLSAYFIYLANADIINANGCGMADFRHNPSAGQKFQRPLQPWIVYIVTHLDLQDSTKYGTYSCAGSIISPRFVLTSAYCVTNGICNPTMVKVFYNTTTAERGPYVSASNVFYYPDLKVTSSANNIAVIMLNEPLRFDNFVKPVCLPEKSQSLKNKQLGAPNWGKYKDEQGPKTLQYASEKVLPSSDCTKRWKMPNGTNGTWKKTLLCTQGQGKNINQGEAGGPLTVVATGKPAVQVGISSFTFCTKSQRPSAHTRIYSYTPWIKRVLSLCAKWERRRNSH
ncbi:chymotrypsinogen B-like [Amblyomma americanum]